MVNPQIGFYLFQNYYFTHLTAIATLRSYIIQCNTFIYVNSFVLVKYTQKMCINFVYSLYT